MKRMKGIPVLLLSALLFLTFTTMTAFAVVDSSDVAQIGDTGYPDLQSAFDAGGDITLLKDVSDVNSQFTIDKDVVLDLNGKSISGTADDMIKVTAGSFTVNDTSTNHDGSISTTNCTAINFGGDKLIINQGAVSAVTADLYGGAQTIFVTAGDVEVNGGKVLAQSTSDYASARAIHIDQSNSNLTVNGGTIEAACAASYGYAYALEYTTKSSGEIKVTGGTISATTGGGRTPVIVNCKSKDATVAISGGSFNVALPVDQCADGFIPKDNGDGTFGVVELAPIQWFYTWSVPNIYYFADEDPVPSRTTQGTVPTIKREGESSYHAAEDFVTVTWTVTASDALDASTPDDSIATVDENGLVTFSKPGKVKVWLTMTDSAGTKSASKAVSYAPAPAVVKHGDTKTAYASVYAAFNHAEDGDTVILGTDANANNIGKVELKADKDLTLDLNGHKISFSQNYSSSTFGAMFNIKKGSLTVVNSGNGGGIFASGTNARAFNIDGTVNASADDATLTISEGVAVSSANDSCVTVFGRGTLNTAGELTSAADFAIAGNGSAGKEGYVINVTGGSVTSEAQTAIYHPNQGTVNVSGGTITGATGIYQKAGTLNITGGTITGNGAKAAYTYNGDGANATGDAVVIDNCGYPGGTPAPEITGGTFVSEHAAPVASYAYPPEGDDAKTPVGGFVSGGTFNGEINGSLCEEGFVLKANADGTYGVVELAPIQWFNTWSVPNIYYFTDEDPVPSRTTQGTVPTIKREGESSYHVAEDFVTVTWTVTASDALDASTPDDSIATVDKNGLVTFSKPGKIKVWLTMTDSAGTKSANKTVSYALAPAVVKHGDTKTAYASVYAAFNHAEDGDTVILGADATAGNIGKVELKADKDLTLDLNGHKISFSQNYSASTFGAMFNIKKGSLTVVNSGNGGGIFASGKNARAFNIDGTANESADDATLTISEGVAVSSANDSCVTVFGKGTLNSAGELTSAADFAIAGNGSAGKEGYVINVTGGSVTSEAQTAIYHPNQGTVNVSGGAITGTTGIYQKAGTLNITGGTITGNGEKAAYTYNGDGANATGDAVVIDNCGYPGGAPAPEITGGTFISEHASPVASYAYPAEGDGAKEPVVGFVAGGAYSGVLPDDYCADDFMQAATANEHGLYGIVDAVTVTFDADGGTPAPEAQKIEKGSKVGKPDTDPDKDDYIFTGWFAAGSESPFDFDTDINADTVLTAHWISILDKTKADAIDELNKVDVDSYIESHQYKVHQLVETAKTNVRAAETVEGVGEIMDTFKSDLAKYTTLDTAKENAKEELANYKKDVEFADAGARDAIVTEGSQAIDDATTSDEVNKALSDSRKAIDDLPTKDMDDKAKAKKALADAIDEATATLAGAEYTSETASAVEAAIAEANEVLEDAEATTRQYNNAKAALTDAVDALVTQEAADEAAAAEAAAKDKADAKKALQDLIDEAKALTPDSYTAESWTAAGLTGEEGAIASAETVLGDAASDKKAYEEAAAALQTQLDKLVTKAEHDAEALEEAKAAAKAALDEYKLEDYRDAEKVALRAIRAEAREVIDTAKTVDEVTAALDAATTDLSALKTADQYDQEEASAAAAELADAKAAAIAELDSIDLSAYREEDIDAVNGILNAAKEALALEDTNTTEKVAQILDDALNDLKDIPTKQDITETDAQDLKTAQDDAIKTINDKLTSSQGSIAEFDKSAAQIAALSAKIDVLTATSLDQVTSARDTFTGIVDQMVEAYQNLTDAQDAANAKLNDYVSEENLDKYREAEQKSIKEIVTEAKTAVAAAKTPDEVTTIMDDAEAAIGALKTDEQLTKEEQEQYDEQVAAASKIKVNLTSAAPSGYMTAVVKWKKAKGVSGYQVRYSTYSKFNKGVKTVKVNKADTLKTTLTKLTVGSTYYVQVRSYKNIKNKATGETAATYGTWSNTKKFIEMEKAKITSAKARKGKKALVKWKKIKGISGYQIRYSTDKKFKKGVKKSNVKKAKTTKYTIKKLKAGKTYYVQVRTYKKVKGKTVYGNWSASKKFKALK